MKDENINIWVSRDFYLVAICIAAGASLIQIDKTPQNFSEFVLDISPYKAEKIISKHWSRELMLPTRAVIEAINELKTRLHSSI